MDKGLSFRQMNKLLDKVKDQMELMSRLNDDELAAYTDIFKRRLKNGEDLDSLLPEAFAVVAEADYRILGKRPYDVQILGGIALHAGMLAEMATGEGKTLVATMPLYLNALEEKGAILVTANEYLALRDAAEMGEVYSFLGLAVAAGVTAKAEESFTNDEKRKIYGADIVYTTHGTLGFDYLFNNLVSSAADRFMRELHYCIIDEADSVLLDAAQMPLVISGSPRVQSNLYRLADFFVSTLKEGRDYIAEEKKTWLTAEGSRRAEEFFGIDNFYGHEHFEVNRHVILALRAHKLFRKEKDYMVSEKGELILLDSGSGRMIPGVKLRGGQHQALETKEKIEISQENRSVASITYQNLFLLFDKMSGMSGTISDAREELFDVYGKRVVVIPTHRKKKRIDYPDLFYPNADRQFAAAIEVALTAHENGQPVLIVVSTIGETELVSKILVRNQIPHNVLNANNAFWEASIIKEAGQPYSVTVATSMAGRGTDIKLGEGVEELGGLCVIGIGRMSNIRQERQARGRAGRQGDPGSSRFFVSLEDEVVANYGEKTLRKYTDERRRISRGKLKRIINMSQRIGEDVAVTSRSKAMSYDQVLRKQRELMYGIRNKLLDGGTIAGERISEIALGNIDDFFKANKYFNREVLNRFVLDNISYELVPELEMVDLQNREEVKMILNELVVTRLKYQEKKAGTKKSMKDFVRIAALNALDDAWVEQVDYLQQLQSAVTSRSVAQRNPLFEYQKEALESFGRMEKTIQTNMIRNILLSDIYIDKKKKLHILLP
ncbi:MAG: accessory Sec system translocase SecA2 [Lachnospiraceae bacterium]|nr:accessory Sec system translocase SecA2 [Lachnospiraceae bacterium]